MPEEGDLNYLQGTGRYQSSLSVLIKVLLTPTGGGMPKTTQGELLRCAMGLYHVVHTDGDITSDHRYFSSFILQWQRVLDGYLSPEDWDLFIEFHNTGQVRLEDLTQVVNKLLDAVIQYLRRTSLSNIQIRATGVVRNPD